MRKLELKENSDVFGGDQCNRLKERLDRLIHRDINDRRNVRIRKTERKAREACS